MSDLKRIYDTAPLFPVKKYDYYDDYEDDESLFGDDDEYIPKKKSKSSKKSKKSKKSRK